MSYQPPGVFRSILVTLGLIDVLHALPWGAILIVGKALAITLRLKPTFDRSQCGSAMLVHTDHQEEGIAVFKLAVHARIHPVEASNHFLGTAGKPHRRSASRLGECSTLWPGPAAGV